MCDVTKPQTGDSIAAILKVDMTS